jgi:hypothetical protein
MTAPGRDSVALNEPGLSGRACRASRLLGRLPIRYCVTVVVCFEHYGGNVIGCRAPGRSFDRRRPPCESESVARRCQRL